MRSGIWIKNVLTAMRPYFVTGCFLVALFLLALLWPILVRVEFLGVGYWIASYSQSVVMSILVTAMECLWVLIFASLVRFWPTIVLGLLYYGWWLANVLEFRVFGFVRQSNLAALSTLFVGHDMAFSMVTMQMHGRDVLVFATSFVALLLLAHRIGKMALSKSITLPLFLCWSLGCIAFVSIDASRRQVFPYRSFYDAFLAGLARPSWMEVIRTSPFPVPSAFSIFFIENSEACHFSEFEKPFAGLATAGLPILIGIQIESVNERVLSAQFADGQAVFPWLHSRLQQARSTTASPMILSPGGTSSAEFSVLCGLDPPGSMEPFGHIKRMGEVCLPKFLSLQGYATYTGHANFLNFYNRGESYPILGFQKAISIKDIHVDSQHATRVGPKDDAAFAEIRQQIDFTRGPVFLHFVTLQGHAPFYLSDPQMKPVNFSTFSAKYPQTEATGRFFNLNHDVDVSLQHISAMIAQLSLDVHRPVLAYFYGDHEPPLRQDIFLEAQKEETDVRSLIFEDAVVPFLTIAYDKGVETILKMPDLHGIKTLADAVLILQHQLAEDERLHDRAWVELRQLLEHFGKARSPVWAVNQRRFRGYPVCMLEDKPQYFDVTLNSLSRELNRSLLAFQCQNSLDLSLKLSPKNLATPH